MFGHKVADLIGTVAAVLPAPHRRQRPDHRRPLDRNDHVGADSAIEINRQALSNARTPSATTCWATRRQRLHGSMQEPAIDCKDEAARTSGGLAARHGNQWPSGIRSRSTKAIHVPVPARAGAGAVFFLLHDFPQV